MSVEALLWIMAAAIAMEVAAIVLVILAILNVRKARMAIQDAASAPPAREGQGKP